MFEKITAVKPDLPRGDWSLLIRIATFSEVQRYGIAEAAVFGSLLEDPFIGKDHRVETHDGELYGHLPVHGVDGDQLLRTGAWCVARLDTDGEISARTMPLEQLNIERPLDVSYQYADDVTESFMFALRDVLEQNVLTLELELDMLLSDN